MSSPLFSLVAWTNSYIQVMWDISACTRQAVALNKHSSDISLSRGNVLLGQLIARCSSVHTAPSHPERVLESRRILALLHDVLYNHAQQQGAAKVSRHVVATSGSRKKRTRHRG